MKRDWDIIRAVLLEVEKSTGDKEISSTDLKPLDEASVAYNMWLLIEAGMVDGGGRPPGSMGEPFAYVMRMRWQGHELLDSVRNDTMWTRIKSMAKEKGIDLTLDAVKALAKIALDRVLAG